MDFITDANEELKRVDHLVYVSLKYTRTVDMLLNSISRMIDAYDFIFKAIIQNAIEQEKVKEMPSTPIERGRLVQSLHEDDDQIMDNVELCFLLRKLHRAPNPDKEQEYRRHVKMTTFIGGREEVLNIDIITQYYHYQREFFDKIVTLLAANGDE